MISIAEDRDWSCPNCGASSSEVAWIAIDLMERPDLRGFIGDGTWLRKQCEVCKAWINRRHPLLVTRLAESAPVVLALADDLLDAESPPVDFRPTLERVRATLGDLIRDVPGPILLVPFEAIVVAARRDVDADAAIDGNSGVDVHDLTTDAQTKYTLFLDKIRKTASERRLNLALNHLWAIESVDDLRELTSEFPELATPRAQEEPARRAEEAAATEERSIANARLRLVRAIGKGDIDAAWADYETAMQGFFDEFLQPRIDGLWRDLERGRADANHARVVEIGGEIRAIAIQGGILEMEAVVSMDIAHSLLATPGGGRSQRIEEAISLMHRVLEIVDSPTEVNRPELRAETLANLGAAYGARLQHDPVANMARAIAYLREAIDLISIDRHGDLWAMAQTNLALALLEQLKLQPQVGSRTGDDQIREAIAHLEAALRWRSFERDPLDWAFTEVNLGLAFARRQDGDRRPHLLRAVGHFESAAKGFGAAGATGLKAHALHNISSSRFDIAHLEDTDAGDRVSLLVAADEAARASLEGRGLTEAPIDAGRTWDLLARVQEARGNRPAAIDAYRHALEGLTPLVAPRECRKAASVLAAMAVENGDWQLAADSWEIAAEAAARAFESRATGEGRLAEIRENLNIFRWASYALTRIGRLERAVEVLELGRARLIAAWVQRYEGDLDRLGHFDPTLRDRFLELRSQLERSERSSRAGLPDQVLDLGRTAETYRATIEEIRARPGFEGFQERPTFARVSLAARPGVPLAYLITTPGGSAALIVWAENESQTHRRLEMLDVDELTSTDIVKLLINVDIAADATDGYMIAQAGTGDDLDRFLADLGLLVGQSLLKRLAASLKVGRASGVCLVPISLMGLLPLHALPWRESGESRCLIDDFDVIYSPSATVRSICLERASLRASEARRLLAVGNPLPHSRPLYGAESEVQIVANTLPSDEIDVLVGASATKAELVKRLPGASYVHLACHGWSDSREDALSAVLSLADEETLSAREIVDLDGVVARLVVASACQSGVVQGYETSDEALGIATAFVGAGAAGVLASLWPVDDYATALLMSRFYELLRDQLEAIGAEPEPAAALRGAQLWLRELTDVSEEKYLEEHPILRSHREAPHRSSAQIRKRLDSGRPYAAPDLWAPFMLVGA